MTHPHEKALRDAREALTTLIDVIEAAGVINLSRGVELGPVVWSVKCNDAIAAGRAALAHQAEHAEAGEASSLAALDVLAERHRQVSAEGWTSKHDDARTGQLAAAAACYALNAGTWLQRPHVSRDDYPGLSTINWTSWPWAEKWWKPKNERRDLVRAAALILAEIERIDRTGAPQ